MATIGLDKLYYAPITEDENGEETYGTPVQLAKAMSADLTVEIAEATLYADDGMRIEATVSETDLLSFHVGDSGIAEFTYLNDGETSVRGMIVIISRLGEASSSDAESEESDAVKIFLTILLPQFVMADIEPHRLLQVLRLVQAFQERVRD